MHLEAVVADPRWLWLIAALLLGAAEIVAPGFFLIWLGAAALLTALVTIALGIALPVQFALFAVAAIVAVYAGRRWLYQHQPESSDPLLNDRAARLIGQVVLVVEPIAADQGRVRVGDGVWTARGAPAAAGERVRVVGADGSRLIVAPELPAAV